MSDNPNEYNFPFRTNYELYIMAVWCVAAAICFVWPFFFDVPSKIYWLVAAACLVVGLILGVGGIEIYIKKSRLKGYPLEFIDPNSSEAMKLFRVTDKEIISNVTKHRK
ncbi:hypothetical protein [Vibrio fluvialis]|uniref:hypothetical protein n=1 Tax=Vibrio fluvialis TaxID=676 RepID=UPI002572E230|nr:hypothetical protein [Vibrio fluvialis]BEI26520.1 hypothetical protein KKIDH5335_48520 [Vibrio fluvialis]